MKIIFHGSVTSIPSNTIRIRNAPHGADKQIVAELVIATPASWSGPTATLSFGLSVKRQGSMHKRCLISAVENLRAPDCCFHKNSDRDQKRNSYTAEVRVCCTCQNKP